MNEIIILKKPQKELKNLTPEIRQDIIAEISKLSQNPFPTNFKKLKGLKNLYRVRVGDYRVLYRFENHTVKIYRVAHRREVYL